MRARIVRLADRGYCTRSHVAYGLDFPDATFANEHHRRAKEQIGAVVAPDNIVWAVGNCDIVAEKPNGLKRD